MKKLSLLLVLVALLGVSHAQTVSPVSQPGSTAHGSVAQPSSFLAHSPPPAKRLKRATETLGMVDDHTCTLERRYRQEDYLAALSKKEISGYVDLAEGGDADAMYLIAEIPVETLDGKREYPYREPWLTKSAGAGHPIARYLLAGEAHQKKTISDDDYLALIEAAAKAQGSGDIAWRLAYSYQNPTAENGDVIFKIPRNFLFLKGDQPKALYWARFAAAKGNIMAAEDLCTTMSLGTTQNTYGIPSADPQETAHWCVLAAQAMCSERAALSLSGLYAKGIGVPKSWVDSLYWRRVYLERNSRNLRSVGKWEYIGDPQNGK